MALEAHEWIDSAKSLAALLINEITAADNSFAASLCVDISARLHFCSLRCEKVASASDEEVVAALSWLGQIAFSSPVGLGNWGKPLPARCSHGGCLDAPASCHLISTSFTLHFLRAELHQRKSSLDATLLCLFFVNPLPPPDTLHPPSDKPYISAFFSWLFGGVHSFATVCLQPKK